jgi:hypothetical protein
VTSRSGHIGEITIDDLRTVAIIGWGKKNVWSNTNRVCEKNDSDDFLGLTGRRNIQFLGHPG